MDIGKTKIVCVLSNGLFFRGGGEEFENNYNWQHCLVSRENGIAVRTLCLKATNFSMATGMTD